MFTERGFFLDYFIKTNLGSVSYRVLYPFYSTSDIIVISKNRFLYKFFFFKVGAQERCQRSMKKKY